MLLLEAKIVKYDASTSEVLSSSGCVFCDIGLKPDRMKRQWVHHIPREGRIVVCQVVGLKRSS
jgi:hypothetical protein